DFSCRFSSYSCFYNLLFIIGLVFTGLFIVPEIEIFEIYKFMITMLYIGTGIGIIFAVIGLIQTLAVTVIVVEPDRVLFPGLMGVLQIKYDEILSISNYRSLNGRAHLYGFFNSISNNFHSGQIYTAKHSSNVAFDDSSTSRDYTNHITISTARKSVSYTFTGGDNSQFIQALASIIYLTKLKNRKCQIARSAYRAAEIGHEHYTAWRRRHE
ncbi:hypothetical protein KKB99_06250, partial [bacterium]|nr:hypothetical protein [bacterium]MBU1025589.1 hypothetical protein [bacterium]